MVRIKVESYAGYKAEQEPRKFTLGDKDLSVTRIDDRWYEPDATYFRVVATDGHTYVLRCEQQSGEWDLRAFRDAALEAVSPVRRASRSRKRRRRPDA